MSKIEQIIQRDDGSEVKIVAQDMFGAGLHRSVDVYLLARDNSEDPWELVERAPLLGRTDSRMYQLVSRGEVMAVMNQLDELYEQSLADMADYEGPKSVARQKMGGG